MTWTGVLRMVGVWVVAGAAALWAGRAGAKVEGYPYLDNRTLGLFHSLYDAVDGPVDEFEEVHWGMSLLAAVEGGDAMNPLRYMIAFSGYAVGQTAVHTPAWREPYRRALEGFIEKMMHPHAWRDWIEVWGGENPLGPDNIMYSGHLVYMMTLYRQLFGDTKYEDGFALEWNGGASVFESDARTLTEWLGTQAADYVDAAGEHIYSIACEPGRVFVPCNVPHRASQLISDRLYGADLSATNATWVDWVRDRMLDPERGVLHELYFPFGEWQAGPESGEPPVVYGNTGGLYNGWSIWFLHAFDPAWATELIQAWRAYFVVSGEDSPYSDGRTVVVDQTELDGLVSLAFEVGATGFGLILTRLFPDPALHDALLEAWDKQFGPGSWSPTGRRYSWTHPVYPRLIQNGFPLLAATTSPERNIGTNAALVFDDAFFAQPHVRSISDPDVFVNQAFWDPDLERLVLTLNGGGATSAAADVEIVGLDATRQWQVERDSAPWTDLRWEEGVLVITTAPLSEVESSYVVFEAPPTPEPEPEAEPEADAEEPPAPAASGCTAGHGRSGRSEWVLLIALCGLLALGRGGLTDRARP